MYSKHLSSNTKKRQRLGRVLFLGVFLLSLFTPLNSGPAYAIDAPTPLTPANGVTVTATGYGGTLAVPPNAFPEFSWSAVEGATRYKLQISPDIAFTTKQEFTTPLTRYTPTSLSSFPDGLYYWRVLVDAPEVSFPSPPRSFTRQWATPDNKPTLTSPEEGDILEFFDSPAFTWQPVIGAAYYRLQISTNPEFSTLAVNNMTLAYANQPLTKLANGTYYWRVLPFDTYNRQGTASEMRLFQMGYDQIPELLEPLNPSTPTFTPTFRWTAVEGAQYYRLQYSTDPAFAAAVTQVDTRNTTFTPTTQIPNDVNYYWRVQTVSGGALSGWSSVWNFRKQWYIKPVTLTPRNLYTFVRHPFFSWTPVPGASYYNIEISTQADLQGPYRISENTSNPWYTPVRYWGDEWTYYWRVTPYEKDNTKGVSSDTVSYISSYQMMAPMQVYPPYYYEPDNYPTPDLDVYTQPYEDRTVALPVFTWHRLTGPYPTGDTQAYVYRIEVNTDPTFINPPIWTVDTENTNATPTSANPFNPTPGVDYHWRVCPLNALGGSCLERTPGLPWWSQIWRTRIDPGQMLVTSTPAPELLRPVDGAEIVETMPLFEWQALQSADRYEITISRDEGFTEIVETTLVDYPAYAPTASQAQRFLDRLDFGTFYWRVQAYTGGTPVGQVSATWRFQVASQSQWMLARSFEAETNRLVIGTDGNDTADDNYELRDLYASQDKDYWYFGFQATTAATNMTYALLLDIDHKVESGGTFNPSPPGYNYNLTIIEAHQPEFVIFINQNGGTFSAAQTVIYPWEAGDFWGTPDVLLNIDGAITLMDGYVNLKIPNTAIGYQDDTGSYAVSLVSVDRETLAAVDSVPSDPNIPGGNYLSRFSSVSERMNQLRPANDIGGDPATFPSVPPFAWDYPVGGNGASPWAGATMRAYLDASFTTQIAEFKLESTGAYYASSSHPWPSDFIGDNSYYWRIRPRYLTNPINFGVWSQGARFERLGFVPQNLQVSVVQATPTFSWDIVEGAQSYDLQVDNDPNFSSMEININTTQPSYTPTATLGNGDYYWRARIRRWGSVINEWSPRQSFTLTLLPPAGLTPDDPGATQVVGRAPTLCWQPLIVWDEGQPVMAAYKYRVQIYFNTVLLETIETEQTCYTPTNGYADGLYSWRVAMIDGNNRVGDFSPLAYFTKQYPVTTLLDPVDESVAETPTFYWTAVQGAANYRLETSQSPTFGTIFESITTNSIRYTPNRLYPTPRTYYWRVAMIDQSGKLGPFTGAQIILDPSDLPNKLFLPALKH